MPMNPGFGEDEQNEVTSLDVNGLPIYQTGQLLFVFSCSLFVFVLG